MDKSSTQTTKNENAQYVATRANISSYNSEEMKKYIHGAPHLKHASLRALHEKLILKACQCAKKYSEKPLVLDLGAGEGSATLLFLIYGARVVAVDSSSTQLETLKEKTKNFQNNISIQCKEVEIFTSSSKDLYDIITMNSFLHHIPNYLQLIEQLLPLLKSTGQFLFFQDPIRYDTLDFFTKTFSRFSYYLWRIFGGDLIGGTKRYLRRKHGIYCDDIEEDNVEYHVIRNGVDHKAITKLLEYNKFEVTIIAYFSTQNSFFQYLGEMLGVKNTFAIIAKKNT